MRAVVLALLLVACAAPLTTDASVAPFYEPFTIPANVRADVEAALDAMEQSGHRIAWVTGETRGASRIGGQRFLWYFSFVTEQSDAVEETLEDAGLLCHTDLNGYYEEASDRRRARLVP